MKPINAETKLVRWNGGLWKVQYNPCGTVSVYHQGRKMPKAIANKVLAKGEAA